MTDTTTAATETAIATRGEESSITLLPPVQPGAVAAYDALDRHVDNVKKANWLAEQMCSSDYVPAKFKGKPGDGAAAILFGAEVGLSPIASLRSVIVIHGMPGFEARTMKAILMGNGYRFRTIEATRELCRVVAMSPNGDEAEAEITLDDCKLEGWVPQPVDDLDHAPNPDTKTDWVGEWKQGRNGDYYVVKGNIKYITSPRTMLIAKATAAVCRDIAPHLLLGMPAVEDMDTYDEDDQPRRTQPAARRRTGSLRDRSKAAEEPIDAETVEPETTNVTVQETRTGDSDTEEAATQDENTPTADAGPGPRAMSEAARRKWLNRMFALFGEVACTDRDEQIAVEKHISGREVIEHRDDLTDDELRSVVNQLNAWDKAGTIGAELQKILGSPAADEPATDAAEDQE